ncbi:MAG: PAS domain S-box protein, partial [Magnetospirillum sp.]
ARFTEIFGGVKYGPNGSIGLWDNGPALLARYPENGGPGGVVTQAPHPSPSLRGLIANGTRQGVYHTRSGVDSIERVFAFRRVGDHPLYLVVGIADDDYLAEWRRTAVRMAGLVALFMVATVLASWLASRGWRRHFEYAAVLEASMAATEQAHRRSDLILEAAGEGICGVDGDGLVTFVNPAARHMLGWEADEGIGWNLHERAHHHRGDGTPSPAAECPVALTLRDGEPRHVSEDVHWRKDGTSFPVEFTVAPLHHGDRTVGAVTVVRDITQRRWAEAQMAHNLALNTALGRVLRKSLEDVPLAEVLDGALTELLALPGLDLEQRGCIYVADRQDGTLRMTVARHLSPQIMASCATVAVGSCLCGRAAASAEVVFAGCVDHLHAVRYDGMADHGHYCVPILSGGAVLGVLNLYVTHGHRRDQDEERLLVMFADTLAGVITRKRIEETLRDSEELGKTLMNATIDAAFLMDRDGIILAANQALASRFKARVEDLVGRSFFPMIPPALAQARRAQFAQVVASGEPLHSHDERDGTILDNRIYPVRDAAGAVMQVAVFSRDITEQRRSQQIIEKALADLAHSNEELQQFAYVASHDLREPLRTITGHLQLLHRKLKGGLD